MKIFKLTTKHSRACKYSLTVLFERRTSDKPFPIFPCEWQSKALPPDSFYSFLAQEKVSKRESPKRGESDYGET